MDFEELTTRTFQHQLCISVHGETKVTRTGFVFGEEKRVIYCDMSDRHHSALQLCEAAHIHQKCADS